MDFQVAPRVTTRSAVIAALFEQPASPKYDIPSRDFVRQWIREPEQLATLKSSIEKNIDVLQKLRELTAAGKLTEEIKKKTDEILIAASLPKTTPAGLEIGSEAKRDYLAQATVAAIPTFAVETEISAHEWGEDAVGKADRNTWIDKFHLISALPCADEIVTTDPFFHAIYPVAKQSGHVKAVVIKNDEFMDRL